MKRKAFTLTLAAFLLASLAACSNGTNSSKTANETTRPTLPGILVIYRSAYRRGFS